MSFSQNALDKGRAYVKSDSVTPGDYPGIWLVKGSNPKPYRVQLVLVGTKLRGASCTCPHGTNVGDARCSHVVAAMIATRKALQEPQDDLQEPRRVEEAQLPTPTPASASDRSGWFTMGDTFDPATITWVTSPRDLPALRRAIAESIEVVMDLETTGLDPWAVTGGETNGGVAGRVSVAAFTLPSAGDGITTARSFLLPLSHPESVFRGHWQAVLQDIAARILKHGAPLTNQNLKFDLRWIYAHTGVDLTPVFSWDTQIGSHLLDENESTKLKEVVPRVFGVTRWDDFDLTSPGASERVPLFDLGLYACRDTYWTWRLAMYQRMIMNAGAQRDPDAWPADEAEALEYQLGDLAEWCAMRTAQTLTSMEQRGFAIDVEWIKGKIAEDQATEDAAKAALLEAVDLPMTGDPSFAPTSIYFREWAMAAVRDGQLEIISMTKAGNPQWDKAVLAKLVARGYPLAQHLRTYRQANKRLEYLRSWLKFATPAGEIHADYHPGRVVTGRLSCSDPNMQQVTKVLKPAFIARPGFVLVEIDFSQIELRLAAFISRCEPMLQAYRDRLDLHTAFGAYMAEKELEDVTPEERQHAKAGNFGFLYGMMAAGFIEYAMLNYDVVLSEERAVETRESFFSRWAGLEEWHARAIRTAKGRGYITSPIGRVRRLPGINGWGGDEDERKAINSPVQGFGSDLMQIAAASVMGFIPGYRAVDGLYLLGTVHDSIIAEMPEDRWEEILDETMRRVVDLNPILKKMGTTLDVPLEVEATVGRRWGVGDMGKRVFNSLDLVS